jgi:hypothetical protein
MKLREHSDAGTPLKNWEINADISAALDDVCKHLAQQVSIAQHSEKFVQPTLSVT